MFCRVRVRSVGYEICYKTYRVRSVGYESRTEVTELVGLGSYSVVQNFTSLPRVRYERHTPIPGYRHKVVTEVTELSGTGMRFVTEVTELVGLGTVLYRTLPASPGFGMVLYRTLPVSPGFGMKGIPHARVPVRSCYRSHRTCRIGYSVVQSFTNLPRVRYGVVQKSQNSSGTGSTRVCTPVLQKSVPYRTQPFKSTKLPRFERLCSVGYAFL